MRPRKRVVLLGQDFALAFALNLDSRIRVKCAETIGELADVLAEFKAEAIIVDDRPKTRVHSPDLQQIELPSGIFVICIAKEKPTTAHCHHWIPSTGVNVTWAALDGLCRLMRPRGPRRAPGPKFTLSIGKRELTSQPGAFV